MIIVKLKGGLGNQMFQYAYGRSLSLKKNTRLYLDHSFLEDLSPKSDFTFRKYELNAFEIDQRLPAVYSNFFGLNKSSRISQYVRRIWRMPVRSDHSNVNVDTPSFTGNIYLDGYFQSEDYFKESAELICNDFTFKKAPNEENKILIDKIKSARNSVSVHIRRGDYLTIAGGSFYNICSAAYYQDAIGLMRENLVDPTFFIFSADDPSWPSKNLNIDAPVSVIGNDNTGDLGFENMRLMSLCDHNIIANSSFSWWGAWLNLNPKKIVIAPRLWFADAEKNREAARIIPPEWIRI